MTTATPILLLATLMALTGCERQYTHEEHQEGLAYEVYQRESDEIYAKVGDPAAQPTAQMLRAMILKTQSFELDRMPIGYWNYLGLYNAREAEHVTKEEVAGWAENGVTVMKGPEWISDNPEHLAKVMELLDWCAEYDVQLILRDGRAQTPAPGEPDRSAESKADIAAHPAFFGYHLCDEPRFDPETLAQGDYGTATEAARMKQRIPNARPFVSMGGYSPGVESYIGTKDYVEYVDIFGEHGDLDYFCFNQYGGMGTGRGSWNNYFANMRIVREASWRYGIPFWTTQASVTHFSMVDVTYQTQIWQFNASLASGATGVMWYHYYLRDPQKDYRYAPIDSFWRRTDTWETMRDIHAGFHRRYGDLFLNMAVTRVTYLPHGFGGGEAFTPSEVLVDARQGYDYDPAIPMMVSEFIDLEGQRYVMVVNLDREKSVWMVLHYAGEDVEIYSYDWYGEEYRGTSYAGWAVPSPVKRYDDYLAAGYVVGPGESFVQRVDSTELRQSKLTLEMRALAGLPPQMPLAEQLAAERAASDDAQPAVETPATPTEPGWPASAAPPDNTPRDLLRRCHNALRDGNAEEYLACYRGNDPTYLEAFVGAFEFSRAHLELMRVLEEHYGQGSWERFKELESFLQPQDLGGPDWPTSGTIKWNGISDWDGISTNALWYEYDVPQEDQLPRRLRLVDEHWSFVIWWDSDQIDSAIEATNEWVAKTIAATEAANEGPDVYTLQQVRDVYQGRSPR